MAGKQIAAVLLGHASNSTATDVYTFTAIRDEERQKAKAEIRDAAKIIQHLK